MSFGLGIKGALEGATQGVSIGNAITGIGTAVGGIIGGGLGLLGGLFGNGDSTKQQKELMGKQNDFIGSKDIIEKIRREISLFSETVEVYKSDKHII